MYIVHDAHEAIIDVSTFEAVKEELARRDSDYPYSRVRHQHMYAGLIKCGHCGCTLGRGQLRDKHIWRCNTYRSKGKDVCPLNAIPESEIERLIEEVMSSSVIEENSVRSTIKTIVALNDRTLEFRRMDGTSITKAWIPPSRKTSWTKEMKERARILSKQQHKERRKEHEKNHSHTVNDRSNDKNTPYEPQEASSMWLRSGIDR